MSGCFGEFSYWSSQRSGSRNSRSKPSELGPGRGAPALHDPAVRIAHCVGAVLILTQLGRLKSHPSDRV